MNNTNFGFDDNYAQSDDQSLDDKSNDDDLSMSKSKNNKKNDNTLGVITKRFVQLIQKQQDKTIEIQKVSEELLIQKRRIYDITNVLEGIGYIERVQKNKMKWVGGTDEVQMQNDLLVLDEQIDKFKGISNQTEKDIENIKNQIKEEFDLNKQLNYLTSKDFQQVLIKMYAEKMLAYCGQIGDNVQIGSNSQTGSCEFTIETPSNGKPKSIFWVQYKKEENKKLHKNISGSPHKSIKVK